jgi:hypothetical protein
MRFNEKELVSLSRQPSERAAELGMKGPKKGDGNVLDKNISVMDFRMLLRYTLYKRIPESNVVKCF